MSAYFSLGVFAIYSDFYESGTKI